MDVFIRRIGARSPTLATSGRRRSAAELRRGRCSRDATRCTSDAAAQLLLAGAGRRVAAAARSTGWQCDRPGPRRRGGKRTRCADPRRWRSGRYRTRHPGHAASPLRASSRSGGVQCRHGLMWPAMSMRLAPNTDRFSPQNTHLPPQLCSTLCANKCWPTLTAPSSIRSVSGSVNTLPATAGTASSSSATTQSGELRRGAPGQWKGLTGSGSRSNR
jgi:hypothetical protein